MVISPPEVIGVRTVPPHEAASDLASERPNDSLAAETDYQSNAGRCVWRFCAAQRQPLSAEQLAQPADLQPEVKQVSAIKIEQTGMPSQTCRIVEGALMSHTADGRQSSQPTSQRDDDRPGIRAAHGRRRTSPTLRFMPGVPRSGSRSRQRRTGRRR